MPAQQDECTPPIMSRLFTATVFAFGGPGEAIEKVGFRLPLGFRTTGEASVRSPRHRLWNVEVENQGGDVNECWVRLTSYGISPSAKLGSLWAALEGDS